MFKELKSILFAVGIVMVFTAQANHPDEKGQQRGSATHTAKPASVVHNNQNRPQAQVHRTVPSQIAHKAPPKMQNHMPQSSHQQKSRPVIVQQPRQPAHQNLQPRVYAVIPSVSTSPNNRLFHRQYHKHWQPLYNFYDNQYHFYPYVDVTSPVELSGDYVSVGFEGQNYYYDQGTFYQQDETGQYMAVAPPIGIIVNSIPAQARQINVNNQVLYRYKGVFYVQMAQGFQVVGPVQSP